MPAIITVASLYREIRDRLSAALGSREAEAATKVIFEDIRGLSHADIVLYGHREIEPETAAYIRQIAGRIADGMPVQYAVGCAMFYGMKFKVSPAVLIPRPETEGLVDMIVADWKTRRDLKVLDCGTGSGCIAVALARNLPFSDVCAIDISDDALDVARTNAKRLRAKVDFCHRDILTLEPCRLPEYNIIVSNPPYIAESESQDMDVRVKCCEPKEALFVPDSDPLRFYRPIAVYAKSALLDGGKLYFEINPRFATQIHDMLTDCGFVNVTVSLDYLGRARFASAVQPSEND